MKRFWLPVLLLVTLLFGCGASQLMGSLASSSPDGGVNAFNPYMHEELPNMRHATSEGASMLSELGAQEQSIVGEAKHRKGWREEIYPVVFGERKAPHEIIVVLNFSEPACEELWSAVTEASKSLNPADCKIVVFGNSDETYGTDLMGVTIWLNQFRKGQSMAWLGYALSHWNKAKAALQKSGKARKFTNEYDAVARKGDFPIHYGFLSRINPPIPANRELAVARYCYDAGNVNMYQATQVCQFYGVRKLPAVIVDGKPLESVSAESILAALR